MPAHCGSFKMRFQPTGAAKSAGRKADIEETILRPNQTPDGRTPHSSDPDQAQMAAACACWSKSQDAAESSVYVVHKCGRELGRFGAEIALVQGDQGGHVDDGVLGQAR
jgi:hypothetical protein